MISGASAASVSSQKINNPIIIIDDPIQITDNLVGRYTVCNRTCDTYILCEVWQTGDLKSYIVNLDGWAIRDRGHGKYYIMDAMHVHSSHKIHDTYTRWTIPINKWGSFQGSFSVQE
ncbi:MAG: hypothetical protein CVV28_01020 [Methanobacteriales archaeon HGW-Methanobacteriales-1]|jgi:hypothetical protein|nr:MAG: hypothetical protein CVV28_01020 [Methanobacteriales archaeon HGW-Methanobacteriales-1]